MESLDDRWFSVEEIAAYLGVSKETIYRWLDKGKVPSHRMGKLWKFKPREVDSWIMSGGATDRVKQQSLIPNSKKATTKENSCQR